MRSRETSFEELDSEALKPASESREGLVNIRQAAAEEAELRYQEYLDGKAEAISGEAVFRKYQADLR
jgi:hypothetical protein